MMKFRVASGREDFEAAVDLWDRRYGRSAGARTRIRALIQNGSLIVAQDSERDRIVGAVPLDFLAYDNTLLVPFNLIPEDDDGRALRQHIHLITRAAIRSAVRRILLYADETEACRKTIREEFDACVAGQRLPVSLEIAGTVDDYFCNESELPVSSLFIRRAERPDINRKAPATMDAQTRTAYDVSCSNRPEFLAKVEREIEGKTRSKDTKDSLDSEDDNKDLKDKSDKDSSDGIKNKEIADTDKINKDSQDKAEKEGHDKNEKDIQEVDKQASDSKREKEQTDKDPGEKDKEQSDKDPSDKDKEQSDKDPGEKDKEQSDKDPDEKTSEKGKEQSDKGKDSSDKDPGEDGGSGGGGGGGGGGGKQASDKEDPGEGEEQFIGPNARDSSGPRVEIDLEGTQQAIIYREIGIEIPAFLSNVAKADRRLGI